MSLYKNIWKGSWINQITRSTTVSISEYIQALKILTLREIEVLEGVSSGCTSREIGDTLGISPATVQTHRNNICEKLGLEGYRELFHWCLKYMNHSDIGH